MKTSEERERIRARFQQCFFTDEGKVVLEELAEFCGANAAPFCDDARKQDYMQGRRSVYCEIQRIIKGEGV